MAAAELLDYNQVQEQSPSTGDSIPSTGGPIIWQFRADPNLAWDPSQSFFAMDVTVRSVGYKLTPSGGDLVVDNTGLTVQDHYLPGGQDLRPFFPLRCFNGASHVIDGVTVASTTHPYLDKIIQEKYLHESTKSNMTNFESLQLARAIDDGVREHNIFKALGASNFSDLYADGWTIRSIEHFTPRGGNLEDERFLLRSNVYTYNPDGLSPTQGGNGQFKVQGAMPTHTILFQPPFDFWTKHQRVSGGNHQITLNLRGADSLYGWGLQAATPTPGLDFMVAAHNHSSSITTQNGSEVGVMSPIDREMYKAAAMYTRGIAMKIDRIRLFRRMVRFTVERPIATQEFNLTEMQLYVGQSAGSNGGLTTPQVSQNFLLPSSTFGLVFWWRKANNDQYDVFNDYAELSIPNASSSTVPAFTGHGQPLALSADDKKFRLRQFYFTYGGETYPAQRITDIATHTVGNASANSLTAGGNTPFGYEKLQMLSNQLMGVYNMPMEYLNTSFSGRGLMDRLDDQMFFFPVAKHSNSDNSDLQVFWEADTTAQATLCVAALYDARIELSYNAANQLEKVTKTEWK